MNRYNRKVFKKGFYAIGASFNPPFIELKLQNNGSGFIVLSRAAGKDVYQFIALSFFDNREQVFLEVARSSKNEFPFIASTYDIDNISQEASFRLRADEIWEKSRHWGGWAVENPDSDDPFEIAGIPEGIFKTPEEAVDSLKNRITKNVIPFFGKIESANL